MKSAPWGGDVNYRKGDDNMTKEEADKACGELLDAGSPIEFCPQIGGKCRTDCRDIKKPSVGRVLLDVESLGRGVYSDSEFRIWPWGCKARR